jgi:hypothetical protein
MMEQLAMSFLPALSGGRMQAHGAWARLHVCKSGRMNDRRRLMFVFSRDLVEKLGWQGGERFVVSLGVDEDLGAFQISRVSRTRTGLKLIPKSNAAGFRLGITLPPEIHGIRPADFLDTLLLPMALNFEIQSGAALLRTKAAAEIRSKPRRNLSIAR